MNPDPASPAVEVETKFLGGKEEFAKITSWLENKGFSVEHRDTVQRLHIYFDDGDTLSASGCRLRCVVAIGEWYRYDFKVDVDPRATLEFSVKRHALAPLASIIDELLAQAKGSDARNGLMKVRNTARIIGVFVGEHQKAKLWNRHTELEVSWDTLTSVESGTMISEVEVELMKGPQEEFEDFVSRMAKDAGLERVLKTKLDRLLKGKLVLKAGETGEMHSSHERASS